MSLIAYEPRLPGLGPVRDRALTALFALAFRALRVARRRRLEVSLIGGLIGVLLVASVLSSIEEAPAPEPAKPAPVGVWMDVARPFAMFAYDSQEFAPAPVGYAMRRHTTGGGREDILTAGSFAGDGPWLRLTIHQVGEEAASDLSLFVETARRAGEAGLALDNLSNAVALPTRFGVAEWADARLSSAPDGARRDNCAAFRFAETKPVAPRVWPRLWPGGSGLQPQPAILPGRPARPDRGRRQRRIAEIFRPQRTRPRHGLPAADQERRTRRARQAETRSAAGGALGAHEYVAERYQR